MDGEGAARARGLKPEEAAVTSPMKTTLDEEGYGQQDWASWRQIRNIQLIYEKEGEGQS